MQATATLLPEWHPQEAVILSWPDAHTDWAKWLTEAQTTYIQIIEQITRHSCPVILLARPDQVTTLRQRLPDNAGVMIVSADYDDTWVRDYGFLTCQKQDELLPISFNFNGWGNKFNGQKDNQINLQTLAPLCRHPMTEVPVVLEGGALEIDGDGVLLSTAFCLSNPERNGTMSLTEYQQLFSRTLGCKRSVILNHGHLEGDDTDGHIDTLVRFTPDNNLVIQTAFNRPDDSHFEGLQALLHECQSHFPNRQCYQLPLPHIRSHDGDRLPASYANFLISNQCVFAPVYGEREDDVALKVLAQAYPDFDIIAVNCRTLVQQYGSLHCISMQVPEKTLKPSVVTQLQSGVSEYHAE